MTDLILALDFGGTKLSAALTTDRQSWLGHERVFSPRDATADYDLDTMIAMGRRLLDGRTPTAVGVSFGGPVDYATGTVRLSHHVAGWENTPLQAHLEATFEAPTRVDNDANVAALGEHRYGAGRGVDSMLYVTVSTGVGSGWILGGRPWRGWQGIAGEIGHTVVDPDGPACLCGKRGCVERLASGPYMAQDYARDYARDYAPQRGSNDEISGELVAKLAKQGDELAQKILMRGAQALGIGLGNAANLVNPQRVVLGGGVTKSGGLWWQTVQQTVATTTLPEVDVDVVTAELGDDAPLWGAVILARL